MHVTWASSWYGGLRVAEPQQSVPNSQNGSYVAFCSLTAEVTYHQLRSTSPVQEVMSPPDSRGGETDSIF